MIAQLVANPGTGKVTERWGQHALHVPKHQKNHPEQSTLSADHQTTDAYRQQRRQFRVS
jgi:hypothetical protein